MKDFKAVLFETTISFVVKRAALILSCVLPVISVYEALNHHNVIINIIFAFVLINSILAICLFDLDKINISVLSLSLLVGIFTYKNDVLTVFFGVVSLTILISYLSTREKVIKNSFLEEHTIISDSDFSKYYQISPSRDNYYFLIKLCYYKSKLNWLDKTLKFFYEHNPDVYREFNSLLFQYILWANVDAYKVLKENHFFLDGDNSIPDDVVDLIHYYNYEEKFDVLVDICKDIRSVDKNVFEKMNTTSFGQDENTIFERLKLEVGLIVNSLPNRKILKI